MSDTRKCTCHPDDAPVPCQHKYALHDCLRSYDAWIEAKDNTITRLTAEVERLRAALEWRPTHRHVKRGSTYQVVGTAELQAADLVKEGTWLTVYRAEDGELWARPTGEFCDGRFVTLPPPPALTQEKIDD